jgi:hypothetical protein
MPQVDQPEQRVDVAHCSLADCEAIWLGESRGSAIGLNNLSILGNLRPGNQASADGIACQ